MEQSLEPGPAVGSIQSGGDSVIIAMARKPKIKELKPQQVVEPPKPRVTSFVARDCTSCASLRESDENVKGKSFSRVYGTAGRVRYVRCDYCGNTWKQTPELP